MVESRLGLITRQCSKFQFVRFLVFPRIREFSSHRIDKCIATFIKCIGQSGIPCFLQMHALKVMNVCSAHTHVGGGDYSSTNAHT